MRPIDHLRLRQVAISPLVLHRYWLEEFRFVSGAPEPSAAENSASGLLVRVSKPVVEDTEISDRHRVRIRVRVDQGDAHVDATISGLFSAGAEASAPAVRAALMKYNAPSILYGLLRGITVSVTGASDSGRIDLPAVNVQELVDR